MRKKEGGYAWKMNLQTIHKHYENILDTVTGEEVDTETLFIKGEHSKYIQEKDKNDILGLFPNSNTYTIKGSGHWVHAEQPQELLKVILEFLKK